MALGIDIYRYQTVTDWDAVRRAVAYVWVKLTDGGGPAVVRGDAQVNGAKSVGLPVGGYHYAQLSPSPEAQADVLLAEVDRLGAHGLVPMLDIEAPFQADQGARVFAERFCDHIASRGRRPGVYMNNAFAKVLRPDTWPCNPVIWIARYGAQPDYGGRYDIHQYSSSGTVPGISGAVDLNESYTDAHFTAPIQEEDMEFGDQFTDWAGNRQTVESWMNHVDKRLAELHGMVMTPLQSKVDPATSLPPLRYLPHIDGYASATQGVAVETKDRVIGVQTTTDATNATVQQLSTGGIDVEALAQRVAELIGPGFVQAVADEIHKRLES
jgi:GH25 family lysozyme M1 (1,4-beta-N-acetylmuramidase)